ncbi:NUDIX domain-containing protein [Gracilibacillus caseinilyticus]|uniref:NUDIX domain-containing protein n=1 Tax=Gracilibacillus caseinilyticus TaxID=2932256 RepID=A0ABY4ERK2_9BACI|nr:NUDIX domain-containing protein [Gracilibacillus caseinilyticus]UOQ47064.1 NUDIX domain-containing protein [Gracilibacillus caseinilyticus]
MEQELLKVFDENEKHTGIASRADVHTYGYWHEVFHCWFISRESNTDYVYIQLRSDSKKDYPGLFDITAAGHLLANETVEDGVREIEEELGVTLRFDQLSSLGIMKYTNVQQHFIDKEMANVFLNQGSFDLEDFTLQEEEVAGIIKVTLKDFEDLWLGEKEQIHMQGFTVKDNTKKWIEGNIGKNHFVPHQSLFYESVVERIKHHMG